MRVLVTGGRNYGNYGWVNGRLDAIHRERGPITLIIEGGASGADRLAREWAKSRRVPYVTEEADWGKYGPAAGPIRNSLMLATHKPDLVVAFPGRNGTRDMVNKAEAAKVEVFHAGGR